MEKIEQQIGDLVSPLPPGTLPDGRILFGRWVRMEPLSAAAHAEQLYDAVKDADPSLWTYMPYGPFEGAFAFRDFVEEKSKLKDIWFYAYVHQQSGLACGMGSFMRADAANGVIEIGHIWLSPALQKTRQATELIYLMIRHAFADLGMRRLEWKCDALNAPSRRAAQRFGFIFEGVFRQHFIVKGRNRDTAWFSIIDKDWPRIHQGYEAWLAEDNFDAGGHEKSKLVFTA
jgi:RimJ/RimL family protein N-acetyltransferase